MKFRPSSFFYNFNPIVSFVALTPLTFHQFDFPNNFPALWLSQQFSRNSTFPTNFSNHNTRERERSKASILILFFLYLILFLFQLLSLWDQTFFFCVQMRLSSFLYIGFPGVWISSFRLTCLRHHDKVLEALWLYFDSNEIFFTICNMPKRVFHTWQWPLWLFDSVKSLRSTKWVPDL